LAPLDVLRAPPIRHPSALMKIVVINLAAEQARWAEVRRQLPPDA
jgi:hypothetical protein